MKVFVLSLLGLFALLIIIEIISFSGRVSVLNKEYADIMANLSRTRAAYSLIEDDLRYYRDPANLLKEARGQLNNKLPGETMTVLVEPAGSSSSVSQ